MLVKSNTQYSSAAKDAADTVISNYRVCISV